MSDFFSQNILIPKSPKITQGDENVVIPLSCILHTTNQTDITNNFASNLSRNCHSSIPKLWPLLKKILKNWIIGKKTANVKISPFRSVESTLNHQLIKPPVKTTLWLQNFNIIYLNLYKSKWVLTRRFLLLVSTHLFSKHISLHGFEDFTNPFLLWNFSRTKYFNCQLLRTNLKWKGTVTVEGKWSL